MTTDSAPDSCPSLNSGMDVSSRQLLLISCLLGAVVGVLFIIVQPLFGMDTLTSRHAAAYQQLGDWSVLPAVIIAWVAHLAVSVFYGLISGIVMIRYRPSSVIVLFTVIFSWVTTLIAPPANALIVQLVSFQEIRPQALPGLNFLLDAKFLLHLLFFAAISSALFVYRQRQQASGTPVVLSDVAH
ncbi:hypothetical protein ACUNV4_05620 [Granulosicoccus sp. 3-233]|uniref:hypothetical protein n=1 Tax=Granulosicoccus sp. 3-233 TaxID=3417969 RepID=UPI003D34EF19